jgi:hypothetical protein
MQQLLNNNNFHQDLLVTSPDELIMFIIQVITLCMVSSREYGPRPVIQGDLWSRSCQVTDSHGSRVLISWFLPHKENFASWLENHQIPILKSILIELGLNPWSWSEHDKSCFLKFKQWRWTFCLWMESILLGHIYHITLSVMTPPQVKTQCLKWTIAQSPNATNILFGRPKAAPN